LLADDLIMAEPPCLRQMAEVFEERGGNVVAVMEVPRDHTNRYGILDIEADDGQIATVAGLVEKPEPAAAPSTLSIIGRYILDPMVLHELDRQDVGAGGEIQLTDAMARTIGQMPFHGLRFAGQRFDCGDKVGFLLANVAFGLAHEDFGSEFRDALAALLATKN
jgi:UTP--glucose-1-phosphate uridylyltransferase